MRLQQKRARYFDLDVELTRKPIKNFYIRVHAPDGAIRMSVPLRATERDISSMLEERYSWIVDRQSIIQSQPWPEPVKFTTGELHELWGSRRYLRVVESSLKPAVRVLLDSSIEMSVRPGSSREQRGAFLDDFYRSELKAAAAPLVEKWSHIMTVDVSEWRIKKMKTRWGTCNTTEHRVWLSLMLAKRSPACLEAIVVHELTHLIERNHTKRFWSFMDSFHPEWREAEPELNSVDRSSD